MRRAFEMCSVCVFDLTMKARCILSGTHGSALLVKKKNKQQQLNRDIVSKEIVFKEVRIMMMVYCCYSNEMCIKAYKIYSN